MSTPDADAPAPQPAPTQAQEINDYLKAGMANDPVIDRPLAQPAPAEPAARPAAVAAPVAADAGPRHKHPAILVTEARSLGLTAEEIGDTPPAELADYVRTLAGLTRGQSWEKPAATATEPAKGQPAAPPPPAPAKGGLDWGEDADSLIDPDVRAVIERAFKPLMDELAELRGLKARTDQLEGFERHRQAETQFSKIDRLFAGLGDGYAAVFGTGGRADLDPAGPEMTRRQAVVERAARLAGDRGDFARAFAQVAQTMFGSLAAAAPAAPPRPGQPRTPTGQFAPPATEDEWAAATVQRPTNRAGAPEPKGENRAARAIADIAARSGVSVNGTARSEDFPD